MKVLLLKSVNEDTEKSDKFGELLHKEHYPYQVIPVIAFDFCNLDQLLILVNQADSFDGIIFTSPRCVQSVKKSLSFSEVEINRGISTESIKAKWACKHIFCVGPATAQAAQELFPNLSAQIITSDDGNAESLGVKIVQIFKSTESYTTQKELRLLYPAGNLKRDTLQNILIQNDIKTEPIIVYKTVENPELRGILLGDDFVKDIPSSCFVFFSPSGLHHALEYVKDRILNAGVPLIALGPSTMEALLSVVGVDEKCVYQCKNPTPEGLLELLKTVGINKRH